MFWGLDAFFSTCVCFLFFLFRASAQKAENQGPDTISVEEVKSIIEVLSADSLRGRGLLNGGAGIAADYIIRKFRETGLVPGPGQTDIRQDFTLNRVIYTDYNAKIRSEEKTYELQTIMRTTNDIFC